MWVKCVDVVEVIIVDILGVLFDKRRGFVLKVFTFFSEL